MHSFIGFNICLFTRRARKLARQASWSKPAEARFFWWNIYLFPDSFLVRLSECRRLLQRRLRLHLTARRRPLLLQPLSKLQLQVLQIKVRSLTQAITSVTSSTRGLHRSTLRHKIRNASVARTREASINICTHCHVARAVVHAFATRKKHFAELRLSCKYILNTNRVTFVSLFLG